MQNTDQQKTHQEPIKEAKIDESDFQKLSDLSDEELFLDHLGLKKFYPEKMQLKTVMRIQSQTNDLNLHEIALMFLRNLIMINLNCRDKMVQEWIEKCHAISNEEKHETEAWQTNDVLNDIFDSDDEDSGDGSKTIINPLDLTVAIFKCSSPMLKQILGAKLYTCQLAVPFAFPKFGHEDLTVSTWHLRSIITESKAIEGSAEKISVDCPCHIVSFIRLGRPCVSKSKLVNEVLTDQYYSTFFNKDCPLGTSKRCISDGLIEGAWYIPSSKSNIFGNVTMFLNLRGDGEIHKEQLQLLSQLSTVVVVMLNIDILEIPKFQNTLLAMHSFGGGILLAIDAAQYQKGVMKQKLQMYLETVGKNQKLTQFCILKVGGEMKSISDIKSRIRKSISVLVKTNGVVPLSDRLKRSRCSVDEDIHCWKNARQKAESILDLIPKNCTNAKEQIVPLQGKTWQSWSKELKAVNKSSQYKTLQEKGKIKQKMFEERLKQVKICENLGPLMTLFLNSLSELSAENDCTVFVLWLKSLLDERSREVLPNYLHKYQFDWQALKSARDKKEIASIEQLRCALQESEYNLAEASFGFEHLCREMGQIFEAVAYCSTKNAELKQLQYQLPTIAAKLLLIGQPFELMDGDVANVPLLWVKAVFSQLKEILGDKKVLALSVLGIQSSGKSTLLNTMFGLQFAVSAGRCTRGVFMQLVPVEEETLPFHYALVIDTEGLRAPELAYQKHSHDNELATFVIGLGDITIVNIKGENTAEVKDVLQIAVHAFLRLKLANKRLNLKQSCVFAHQNVPALDANDKMMQGRQKFVEILDAMTKEAADQENIAGIQSFNDVIDFDSEKNVWYFSDLWRGDPPMAPANPGYSETVANLKESIIFRLTKKRNTYLTITDTIHRIEDLWNGILKDDFIFSFRNSLELKAYNNMERHCQTTIWNLEKFILEFINSDAKTSLANCKTEEDLEKTVPSIVLRLTKDVDKKVNALSNELDEFVEKNTLKDVMIQWTQSTRNRLHVLAENLLMNAKTDINHTKEEMRIRKLKLSEKTKHEMEINDLARNLAAQMRGQKPSENVLAEKFNSLWNTWINKFGSKDIRDVVPVKDQIESILYEKSRSDVAFMEQIKSLPDQHFYKRIKKLEGTIKTEQISSTEHLSFHKALQGLAWWTKEKPEVCKTQTIDITNKIFRKIDLKLAELSVQDTRFDISYATEILNIIVGDIADHNENKNNEYKFNLNPPFRAMIITHVVHYITVFFTRLNDEYNKKHSPKAQMEEYKGTAWTLFKSLVESKTEELIAACLFRETVMKVVKEQILLLLPIDAQEAIVVKFSNGKYSLMKDILTHLANSNDFNLIKSFLSDPRYFAENWIMKLTNKTLFDDKIDGISKYAKLANTRISNIFPKLLDSVSRATDDCQRDRNANISQLIDRFVIYNNQLKVLPLSKDLFIHVQNRRVSDILNFKAILVKELQDMEERIITSFKETTQTTVRWNENHVPNIMKKIWGCSARCMFCKETCMNTDADHVQRGHPHQCLQHRPQGIGGSAWFDSRKLVVEFCNHWVGTDLEYYHKGDKNISRKYKDYKIHYPDWQIAHNSDVSQYWMWLMCQYKEKLAEMYGVRLPDIPTDWWLISKEKAIQSL